MNTNFERGIDDDEFSTKKTFSERFPAVAAAGVLALVAAVGQNIRDNAIPDEKNDADVHLAQQRIEASEITGVDAEVYSRAIHNFNNIFKMVDYLQPQGTMKVNQRLHDRDVITKRTIPGVKVNGKIYNVETNYVECKYGISENGECNIHYQLSLPYKGPGRIVLTNRDRRVEYLNVGEKIQLSVFLNKEPFRDAMNRLIPNNTAYIEANGWTNVTPTEGPYRTYAGRNHGLLDQKIGELQQALNLLYSAKVARDTKVSDSALKDI